MDINIFPTITSISGNHLNKLEEANRLGIKKLCVFFSTFNRTQRKEYYKILENSILEEIPFAHIRGDFTKNEIYYLKERFNTKFFNFHSDNQHKIYHDFSELKKEIYIENTLTEFKKEEIEDYAGMCLDVSHLENDWFLKRARYNYFCELIEKMFIGCGHISAVKDRLVYCSAAERKSHATHIFTNLSEFNYLLKYRNILPPIMALEVENPLIEQIEAIKYINNLLNYDLSKMPERIHQNKELYNQARQ